MDENELKYTLALRYYNNQDYAKAAIIAENLRWNNPLNSTYLTLTGHINYATGQLDWAVGAYARAIMFDPFNLEAHYGLALAYIGKDAYLKAEECLDYVVSKETETPLGRRAQTLLEVLRQKMT